MNPTPRDPSPGSGSRGEADAPLRTSEGRHRRVQPDPSLRAGVAARRLVAPVVAVLAVVALVGALLFIGRHPAGTGGNLADRQLSSLRAPSSPAASPPAAGSPSGHTSNRAGTAHSPRHTAHRRAAKGASQRTQASPAAPALAPLTVLNNSRIQGLAHHVAAEFEGRGWPIARIGNFTGRLPETTVFYLPGQQGVAQRLAAEYPGDDGIAQLEPRPADLPGTGLTVVLTRYWDS